MNQDGQDVDGLRASRESSLLIIGPEGGTWWATLRFEPTLHLLLARRWRSKEHNMAADRFVAAG